ncbi:MAG: sel1 repeat family protein [Verrucomicrobia bacterium]|nr:sel1 repeat family protein [Verrucomicrobiota bacterium]
MPHYLAHSISKTDLAVPPRNRMLRHANQAALGQPFLQPSKRHINLSNAPTKFNFLAASVQVLAIFIFLGCARLHSEELPDITRIWLSAERGDANAQCVMGVGYFNIHEMNLMNMDVFSTEYSTVGYNYLVKARNWLEKSVAQGNVEAMYQLGRWYFDTDIEKAAKSFRSAADRGHVEAMYQLGECYKRKSEAELENDMIGAAKKAELLNKAAIMYRKAADLGSLDALNDLAVAYELGHGVPEDKRQAEILTKKLITAREKNRQADEKKQAEAKKLAELLYIKDKEIDENAKRAKDKDSIEQDMKAYDAKLAALRSPNVVYEKAIHGPKIKGLFIGMGIKQFAEVAKGLAKACYSDSPEAIVRTVVGDNTSQPGTYVAITVRIKYEDLLFTTLVEAKASSDGVVTEIHLEQIIPRAFEIKDLKFDEFARTVGEAYDLDLEIRSDDDAKMKGMGKAENSLYYKATTSEGVLIKIFRNARKNDDSAIITLEKTISPKERKKSFN